MYFKSMHYFLEAADTHSFTAAAKKCGVTQTAVSQSISKMERELGFTLFIRNHRDVSLSSAGREFYKWVYQTVHAYERTVTVCRNISSGEVGTFRIGATSVYEASYFDQILASIRKLFPDMQIELRLYPTRNLTAALFNKEIDAFWGTPFDFINNPDITAEDVSVYPMYLVMEPSNPLSVCETIRPEHLSGQTCLILTLKEMPESEKHFRELLYQNQLHFRKIQQMDRIEEITLNLNNKNAVALLPSPVTERLDTRFVIKSVDCKLEIPFVLCYERRTNNPFINSLIYFLRKNLP